METFVVSLLERLLATSVQTALLAAVVWLLCRALPRLSPATQCWMWWLVALQVLVGLCVDPVRLPWLPQELAAVAPDTNAALPGAGELIPLPATAGSTLPPWQITIVLLWLGGLAVMIGASLREWRRSVALLRDSKPCTDAAVRGAVARAAELRGLRAAPRLRMSGDVDSPMVVGQLRPVLVLPMHSSLSGPELEMAVEHELEHLRRADMLLGWVPVLARMAFFFHPLVHLAVREYGIAREAACDAAVVDSERRSRRDYGDLLVRLGTADHGAGLAATSRTFHALRRRLTLLQHAKYLPRAGSITVLLIALAGVLPLRLVAAAPEPEPSAQLIRVAAPAVPPAPAVAPPGAQQPLVGIAFRPNADDYYPSAARSLGEQGTVRISLCHDDRGIPIDVVVNQSSGYARLDEAAVRWGKAVRMKPAVINELPQPGCVVMPVQFRIPEPQETAYTGTRMSASFQNIDVRTLLRVISETSGRTIVVDDSVTGTVTLRVDNVPWDQVLDIVVNTKDLTRSVRGDEIVITAGEPGGR